MPHGSGGVSVLIPHEWGKMSLGRSSSASSSPYSPKNTTVADAPKPQKPELGRQVLEEESA